MLEGIETGYEEKYDFPVRDGPPFRLYTLATVPRTGSTYVSHLLWQTGCLGAPLEYLNFLPGSPYSFAHGRPDRQRELLRSLLHRRTSPNGLFGLKCFSAQLRELQKDNPTLLMEVIGNLLPATGDARVIRLKRRDKVAHAISYARAALSGIWRKEQESAEAHEVPYSPEAVDHARRLLEAQEADWDGLLTEQKARQLTIWYEDVVDRPAQAVWSVAEFLEVELDPAAAVNIPSIEQQSQVDSTSWAREYSKTR